MTIDAGTEQVPAFFFIGEEVLGIIINNQSNLRGIPDHEKFVH